MTHSSKERISVAALLDWYARNGRDLPWRAKRGERPEPYRVWLSEIMLQQTTTATVKPYFARFLSRWPDFASLAAAPVEDVMQAWAGLGYYSRARNMHRCAALVACRSSRSLPEETCELQDLPGIGPYTAAAIAAIAFGKPAVVVDGNVERVICRLFAIDAPPRQAKQRIRDAVASIAPGKRPGDFAQAMMDLGATICTPRRPRCFDCPLMKDCRAQAQGQTDAFPVKAERKARPLRYGAIFYLRRRGGDVLLRTRPPHGLLGGMTEFPGSDWTESGPKPGEGAPATARWLRTPGDVRHDFTHFRLQLTIYVADAEKGVAVRAQNCRWVHESLLAGEALPTLMRKVAALAKTPRHQPSSTLSASPERLS